MVAPRHILFVRSDQEERNGRGVWHAMGEQKCIQGSGGEAGTKESNCNSRA